MVDADPLAADGRVELAGVDELRGRVILGQVRQGRYLLEQLVLLRGQLVEPIQIDIVEVRQRGMLVGVGIGEQLANEAGVVGRLPVEDRHAR